MNYSSATIRNEMAELTNLGYLEQPHTSAGRIPSAAGYRLYVDELMSDYRLSIDETKSITLSIEEKMQQVDKMMEKVAKLVSQATDLPAISVASRQGGAVIGLLGIIGRYGNGTGEDTDRAGLGLLKDVVGGLIPALAVSDEQGETVLHLALADVGDLGAL